MRKLTQALVALFVTLVSSAPQCDLGGEPAFGSTEKPSTADVLSLMARVPEKAHPSRPGHYEQAGDAREIAAGIANAAGDRETAALLTVFAAYESSNQKCAIGDGGRSAGAFQLQYVPREVACDPMRAASIWLAMAKDAQTRCLNNEPDERLAVLTSGSCSRGRAVARTRVRIAREIAAATP
jgi:hypothetical protein